MGIKEDYKVIKIENKYTKEWILQRHYAKRKCSVSYAFGLFNKENIMVGVCTFGYPPNYNYNNGKCVFKDYEVLTLELNRLITEDNLERNVLSYFVSQSLNKLPKPSCIVSYSDPNNGHHGYIYQATNWIYTGHSTPKFKYYFEDGTTFDIRRGIDRKGSDHGKMVKKERLLPTERYIYFNGNKRDVKDMKNHFKLNIIPYPKGDNVKYNIGILNSIINLDSCLHIDSK